MAQREHSSPIVARVRLYVRCGFEFVVGSRNTSGFSPGNTVFPAAQNQHLYYTRCCGFLGANKV